MMTNSSEVLIVGAGPVGMATAIALRMSGCTVRIVEREEGPRKSSRALGVQPRTMEELDKLGVAETLAASSRHVGTNSAYNRRGLVGRMSWYPPNSPYPHTYVAPQTVLEDLLRRRLAELGVAIEWRTELAGFDQDEAGVTAHFADGSEKRSEWLIGADGAHSLVRKSGKFAFEGRATGQSFFLADLVLDRSPGDDSAAIWLLPSGPVMLMRTGEETEWRLFADVSRSPLADHRAQELLDNCTPGLEPVTVRETCWTSVYDVQVRHADRYRDGRVFIAGDAAHVFPPFGAQGMNTGILEGLNLAWKLAWVVKGAASPELLETYEQERRPIAAQVISEVERRRKSFAARSWFARFARDLMFRVVASSGTIQRRVSLELSQLTHSYRGRSWLSEQHDNPRRARAGDRAPDAPLGQSRLHRAFSPTGWTWLCFGGLQDPASALATGGSLILVDPTTDEGRHIAACYDAAGDTIILIRPDGHIGFRGRVADLAGRADYLERIRGLSNPARRPARSPI